MTEGWTELLINWLSGASDWAVTALRISAIVTVAWIATLVRRGLFRQGDVVKLGEHSGLVEEVTLRYVQLRDYDGHVHFVPNGRIGAVVNLSRGHAQAVIDGGVAYRENLDRVMALLQQVAEELREDEAFRARILADFELAGVERWDDSAVMLRGRFQVAPLAQWDVRREYLRRLKAAFDQHGIEIPFPQLTLHAAPGFRNLGLTDSVGPAMPGG
jgi:moderate conductance mechanosensitive channel